MSDMAGKAARWRSSAAGAAEIQGASILRLNQDFGVVDGLGAGLAVFFSVGPSFTNFASKDPSRFFQ